MTSMKHAVRQPRTATLADLCRAMETQRAVTLTYAKSDGETVRTVEVFDIRTTQTGGLIVQAMDRALGEARTFCLGQIRAYTLHRSGHILTPPQEALGAPVLRSRAQLVALELGRDERPSLALAV